MVPIFFYVSLTTHRLSICLVCIPKSLMEGHVKEWWPLQRTRMNRRFSPQTSANIPWSAFTASASNVPLGEVMHQDTTGAWPSAWLGHCVYFPSTFSKSADVRPLLWDLTTYILIRNPTVKDIAIYLRWASPPVVSLCALWFFEDCFSINLRDLRESNIIHYVVFHHAGISSPHPPSAAGTLDLLRNQVIKCFSVLSNS